MLKLTLRVYHSQWGMTMTWEYNWLRSRTTAGQKHLRACGGLALNSSTSAVLLTDITYQRANNLNYQVWKLHFRRSKIWLLLGDTQDGHHWSKCKGWRPLKCSNQVHLGEGRHPSATQPLTSLKGIYSLADITQSTLSPSAGRETVRGAKESAETGVWVPADPGAAQSKHQQLYEKHSASLGFVTLITELWQCLLRVLFKLLLNNGLREFLWKRRSCVTCVSSKTSGTWRSHWSSKLAGAVVLTNTELGEQQGLRSTSGYLTYTTLTSATARLTTQHNSTLIALN